LEIGKWKQVKDFLKKKTGTSARLVVCRLHSAEVLGCRLAWQMHSALVHFCQAVGWRDDEA